jgi:hypothetical protein
MRSAISQIGGPTSTVAPSGWMPLIPLAPPPAPSGASSLPSNLITSASPPPRPVPAPVGPIGRHTIMKPTAIPVRSTASKPPPSSARPRRSSLVNRDRSRGLDEDVGAQLPPGSAHTGLHQHRKTTSILSRPSVRIEVHELRVPFLSRLSILLTTMLGRWFPQNEREASRRLHSGMRRLLLVSTSLSTSLLSQPEAVIYISRTQIVA